MEGSGTFTAWVLDLRAWVVVIVFRRALLLIRFSVFILFRMVEG